MSPNYAGDDTDKIRICEQAGIREYPIVKPYGPRHERDFSLYGYRLVDGRYRPWGADAVAPAYNTRDYGHGRMCDRQAKGR
jgi:hypothetical protein